MFLKWMRPRWAVVLIATTSSLVLAMHAYLGSFSRFMADDYCSAAESLKFGVLRAAWFWYRTWTGRYSANVLDALFGAIGPGFTPAVTTIVLLLWLAALFAVIQLLAMRFGEARRALLSFALASSSLFVTFALEPNLPQALYWGQGMRSVVPPLIVLTAGAAVFLFFEPRRWSSAALAIWMILSFALAFGGGGFSETYAALQLVIFGLALAGWILAHRRAPARNGILFLSAGLVGAMISIITVIIAPGNPIRASYFPAPPAPLKLLQIALNGYGLFFSGLVATPLKAIALASAVVLGIWTGSQGFPAPRGWKAAGWTLLIAFILTFSCFPPAAYGESDVPPDRTLIIPTYLLVLTLILVGISVFHPLMQRWKALAPASNIVVLMVWVAAIISLSGMFTALPTYAAYSNAWGRFHAEMLGLRRAGAVSATLYTADLNSNNWAGLNVLGDNPKFWLNKCVADYYGLRTVISTTP